MKLLLITLLSIAILGCNQESPNKNHSPESEFLIVDSNKLELKTASVKNTYYDTTFYNYNDTSFVHNGVSVRLKIDSTKKLTHSYNSEYRDSVVTKTNQSFDQVVLIDSGDYSFSFSLSDLKLDPLYPDNLPKFNHLKINMIDDYTMLSLPDLIIIMKGNNLLFSDRTYLNFNLNKVYFFSNMIIDFNDGAITNKENMKKITGFETSGLETYNIVNENSALLFYFGYDSLKHQSVAVCKFKDNEINHLITTEVLNHKTIQTKLGPKRTILLSGQAGEDVIIDHQNLTAQILDFKKYKGEMYLEKIETDNFPVSLMTIYTDSLIENYRITVDNNPENFPW